MKGKRRFNVLFWLGLLLFYVGWPAFFERGLVRDFPPAISVADLNGRGFDWSDVAGQSAIVYFWGAWCPICGAMQNSIQDVAADHEVITVALRSGTADELRDYVRREGLTARVIPDPDGSIAERYGVEGVPTVFFVDRGGRIRFATTGYTTEVGMRLRLWIMEMSG